MKNKKVLLIVIIFLILILVAFAGVYAYIKLDVFKTPKQLFGKYLDNQITQVENINTGVLKTISENLKNAPSSSKLVIESETSPENTTKVELEFKNKPTESVSSLTLGFAVNGEDLEDYALYVNKEKIAVKIPEFSEKYFSVGINPLLDEIQKNLKANNITQKDIDLTTETIEKYKNDFKDLYNKYLEEIKTNFTDDKFVAEKNVSVDVNGTTISANKYTFSMPVSELETIFKDVSSKVLEEEIWTNFLTEEQISSIKEELNNMTENVDDSKKDSTLSFCVYESSGNTVKLELQVDNEVVAEFMLEKLSDTENNVIINTINKKVDDTDVGSKETIKYTIKVENDNTTSVTTNTTTNYEKDDIKALKKYYEENEDYYYTDEMIDETYKNTSETKKATTTLNGNKATTKLSLDSNESESETKITKSQIEYTFGADVKIDDVNDTINLEDYIDNEEKQAELVEECMKHLEEQPNTLFGSIWRLTNTIKNLATPMTEPTDISVDSDDEDDNIDSIFDLSNEDSKTEEKKEVEKLVFDALNDCLDAYKRDAEEDENVNVADYLTINKVSEMMISSYISDIEFENGSTIKCNYKDTLYYITLSINADTLSVDETKAYTESEYQEL